MSQIADHTTSRVDEHNSVAGLVEGRKSQITQQINEDNLSHKSQVT